MPISNLAIQRRRLNELKRLGYQAEPLDYHNYKEFFFFTKTITTEAIETMNKFGFVITNMSGGKASFYIEVKKLPEEKQAHYVNKRIAELLK